jgi:hypothetical protein
MDTSALGGPIRSCRHSRASGIEGRAGWVKVASATRYSAALGCTISLSAFDARNFGLFEAAILMAAAHRSLIEADHLLLPSPVPLDSLR